MLHSGALIKKVLDGPVDGCCREHLRCRGGGVNFTTSV